mmetsp:Transcript_100055/g.137732  ORF Transcript_100055/g.137732 Transcript_100055/m.137732 type:complete len:220 (+) Transcript_100055:75-734(+)
MQEHSNLFDIVVELTSSKFNLVAFLDCIVALLMMFGKLIIYVFFNEIKEVESKHLIDKTQKKVFQFLLLSVVLRNQLDVYRVMSLTFLLFVCMLHWVLFKRCKGLISRGTRTVSQHLKLLLLYICLIVFDAICTCILYQIWVRDGKNMSEIYVLLGFEFAGLTIKTIEENFKYKVSLMELYYREQWTEKGFVFNIVSFLFESFSLWLNLRLFWFLLQKG